MTEKQSNLIHRRILEAAIAAALVHPLIGFVVHRGALKFLPGMAASPWTLGSAFALAWLAMFAAYLRWPGSKA